MKQIVRSSEVLIMGMWLLMACCIFLSRAICFAAPGQILDTPAPASGKIYRIGFHFWKSGNIYDEAYMGITDSLALEQIEFEAVIMNSELNRQKAKDNLLAMDRMALDCIVSMSSEGTQIATKLHLQTPLIGAVINHPLSLGIVADDRAIENFTGLSYFIPPEKQLKLFQRLFPNATHFGMIFDKNNPAGFLAEEPLMARACEKFGIRFSSVAIQDRGDITEGARQLISKQVDLVIVPTNLEVYANLDLILKLFYDRKIPIISLNKQGADNGALAALFADNYKLGRMAAAMFRSILIDHIPPGQIPVTMIETPDLIINLSAAEKLEYEFPPDILVSAAIVLQ